jgi:hypothetical protein
VVAKRGCDQLAQIITRFATLENTVRSHGEHLDRVDGRLVTLSVPQTFASPPLLTYVGPPQRPMLVSESLTPGHVRLRRPLSLWSIQRLAIPSPTFPALMARSSNSAVCTCIVIILSSINANIWIAARELSALLHALNLPGVRDAEQKRDDFFRAIGVTHMAR